jgi:hypothetical protein
MVCVLCKTFCMHQQWFLPGLRSLEWPGVCVMFRLAGVVKGLGVPDKGSSAADISDNSTSLILHHLYSVVEPR